MTIEAPARPATPTAEVADGLSRLLADTYVLYLKTHGYHWNVTGPFFHALHAMFEDQYLELRDAVDEIAERIRAIGPMAPGSFGELASLATVPDEAGAPEALAMVRHLAEGNSTVARTARHLAELAEAAHDFVTVDLATRRMAAHEKAAWMLHATLV
jgi:starvation-inducible DNA-binding protein